MATTLFILILSKDSLLTSSHCFETALKTHWNLFLSDVSKFLQSASFNTAPEAGFLSVHFEEKAK